MPNRIVKESIWTSPNLNKISMLAELHFYRLLPCPDDHGCCECTPEVVKGKCYPLRQDITPKQIDEWQKELESENLIIRWNNGHRQYAIFPTFAKHQRIRSLHDRKTPPPPPNIVDKCNQVIASEVMWNQLTTIDDNCPEIQKRGK